MGLDVYLYRYEDFERGNAAETEFEKRTDPLWKDGITKEDRDSQCAVIAVELGLHKDGYGYGCDKEKVEVNSSKYPDHYFKIGYLRSSYNDGGLNTVLRSKGLEDLYWVFQPEDRYCFCPDWKQTKERIVELRAQYFATVQAGWKGQYHAMFVGLNPFVSPLSLPSSKEAALDLFGKQLARWSEGNQPADPYSNGDGYFFAKEKLNVVAAIPGMDSLKSPGVYLIAEARPHPSGDWYAQALEITEEMVDYVLSQSDPGKFFLHWSS